MTRRKSLNERGPTVAVRVATRLPEDLRERLAEAVREGGCSTSDVMRAALDNFLPVLEPATGPPDTG